MEERGLGKGERKFEEIFSIYRHVEKLNVIKNSFKSTYTKRNSFPLGKQNPWYSVLSLFNVYFVL